MYSETWITVICVCLLITLSNILEVRIERAETFQSSVLRLCFSGADFRGVVRFGVVTNKQVAEAISLKEDETVYLYRRLNSSLVSKVTVL